MPDVITFGTEPNIVQIFGLLGRIEDIDSAAREAGRFISDRLTAADNALADWRGPHSDLFAPEINRQLEQLGELRDALGLAAATCSAVPDGPAASRVPPPTVTHPEPASSTSSAKPKMLDAHAAVSEGQDPELTGLAAVATVSDLRAVAHGERPPNQAERSQAEDDAKSPAEIAHLRIPTTTETTADKYISLPDVGAVVEGFAARSGGFAGWVRQVAIAFANSDTGRLNRLAALGKVLGYDDGTPDLLVPQPTAPGKSDILKLQIRKLPEGMTPAEWAWVFEAGGVGADGRPIHFAIHGWGSDANGAARSIADRYDARGVDAVVIAVDWDAGDGFSLTDPDDYGRAEKQGAKTGDVFAGALSGLALADKNANVAITAHSLGNHVAMRGISQYEDPSGQFTVANYTAIEPAVPDDVADHPAYNGAFGKRVDDLTITINNDDLALKAYELRDDFMTAGEMQEAHAPDFRGPEALGDEAHDGDGIEKIRRLRGDQPLSIVDHDNSAGGGHLGIDPDSSGLVSNVVGAQVDDLAGQPSVSRDAYEYLVDRYGEGTTNDDLLEDPEVRRYIEEQSAKGLPIDEEKLRSLAEGLPPPPGPAPGPAPSPTPGPSPTPVPAR